MGLAEDLMGLAEDLTSLAEDSFRPSAKLVSLAKIRIGGQTTPLHANSLLNYRCHKGQNSVKSLFIYSLYVIVHLE